MILSLITTLGGSLLGTITGFFTKKKEFEKEIKLKELSNAHEVTMLNYQKDMKKIDMEVMEKEIALGLKKAELNLEGIINTNESNVDVERMKALAIIQKNSQPVKGGKMDAFNSLIRPLACCWAMIIVSFLLIMVIKVSYFSNIVLPVEYWVEQNKILTDFICLELSTMLSYFFVSRPLSAKFFNRK